MSVGVIQPRRDPLGHILEESPHLRAKAVENLRLNRFGQGPFCRFFIPEGWRRKGGVYAFTVNGEIVYVGKCDDLATRMNLGYGLISPRNCFVGGQSTNCRINMLILHAAKTSQEIELLFYETANALFVESDVITRLQPKWNIQGAHQRVKTPVQAFPKPDVRTTAFKQSCRDEVLDAARTFVKRTGNPNFSVQDIISELQQRGSRYSESTIRTHVTSRCCANAPANHATRYDDFVRLERGFYRLNN